MRSCTRWYRNRRRKKNYPNKLVASYKHRHLRREIEAESKCWRRMDNFSKTFLAAHPDLDEKNAQLILKSIAKIAMDDTVKIERLNSWIRRFVYSRPAQSVSIDLLALNEQWINKNTHMHDGGKLRNQRPPNATTQVGAQCHNTSWRTSWRPSFLSGMCFVMRILRTQTQASCWNTQR